MDRLKQFHDEFADIPVVVEFRNASWVSEDVFELMRIEHLGYCCVDEPRLRGLMPDTAITTSQIGYVRFHGRNADKWWAHLESHDRYDYLYSESELEEWLPKVREIVENTEQVFLFFNNHYEGKAVQNAQLLSRMLELNSCVIE